MKVLCCYRLDERSEWPSSEDVVLKSRVFELDDFRDMVNNDRLLDVWLTTADRNQIILANKSPATGDLLDLNGSGLLVAYLESAQVVSYDKNTERVTHPFRLLAD